ncbi:MAG: hypothetical protein JWP99_749 [Devosia sp.]|nr:hypothetical protein [Devosia sp.]
MTGASGFVGRAVVRRLRAEGHVVRTAGFSGKVAVDHTIALGETADWSCAVEGCDAVVHAGGRAHVLGRAAAQATATFDDVNRAGTITLAKAAARAGASHFVFISSIAALGETGGNPKRESDDPHPNTPYGQSKLAAEQGLVELSEQTGLVVTCLRPPLVYGPDAGGRFRQMLKWCDRGLPLPLASIRNQRSYLAVENLADAIRVCLARGSASQGLFNVADEGVLSTPELLGLIGAGLGKPARLFGVHPLALQILRQLGLSQPLDKLSGTLVLDTSRFQRQLDWAPPVSLRQGIVDSARHYRYRVLQELE